MVDQYIFSGSLPENASTYVTREADTQLYEGLKAGKFCYVLNSRQSGKSSLRVRTMQRLREDGVQCAAIDLSSGGIQNVPPEQWYADLIDTLIDTFELDLDFGDWWSENQLNTLVTRFRKFLSEVLLVEVQKDIVIFIDEIDSVLSLNFPTDDFFALIRACYNKRVDNSEYNRLTFCLLGVASPSNLIEDKQRTPFNIGKAISLKGFQLWEAKPLEKGLQGKFNNPQVVMQEILHWTGGQPFLTQKLCQFMIEESEQEHPRSVEQVVKSRIIENWESLDEPEHLRTIQARILRDEQRAGYLLELYQQVRLSEEQSEVTADDTLEQSELQLSGLVVRQQGKLRIYNQIYREIFDFNWIEFQLKNLRPYSESFRFWVASGGVDDSRLLRGNALQEAEEWARDKNLCYQDKQYLAASKEKEIQEEIAAKEKEAALERERKDREAAEGRNQLLSEANKKAQRRISIGVVVLVVAVLAAATIGGLAKRQVDAADQKVKTAQESEQKAKNSATQAKNQELEAKETAEKTVNDAQRQVDNAKINASKFEQDAATATHKLNTAQNDLEKKSRELSTTNSLLSQAQNKESKILAILKTKENELNQTNAKNEDTKAEIANVRQLVALAGQLRNQSSSDSDEALRLAAISFNIDNHELKQSLLIASQSQAYQQLKDWKNADTSIKESNQYISKANNNELISEKGLQVQVLVYKIQGDLQVQKKETQEAIKSYNTAFEILRDHPKDTDFTKDNQLLTGKNIESVHRGLIELNPQNKELKKQVKKSLTENLYAQLEYYLKPKIKNWGAADDLTHSLMLNTYDEGFSNLSCPNLQKIDKLWVNADKRFGFSVQKEIWIKTGNRLGITPQDSYKEDVNDLQFVRAVGWYDDKQKDTRGSLGSPWVSRELLIERIQQDSMYGRGGLPDWGGDWGEDAASMGSWVVDSMVASRLINCNL